jgi:integrase
MLINIKKLLSKIFNTKQNYENIKLNKDMLFKDYFMQYLKSLDGATRSRSYTSTLATATHILNGLGHYRMSEINKVVLMEFINGFAQKTYTKGKKHSHQYYSQSMINKVYNLLHGAIKEAAAEDGDQLLRTDFMANIKKPQSNRMSTEPKPLTDEEINMLSHIVSEIKIINVWIHILIYTGVRPSEALALKWSDIDYKNKTIKIQRALSYNDFISPDTLERIKPREPVITNLKNEKQGSRVNYQRRTLKVGDKILTILKDWENAVKSDKHLMRLKRKNRTEDYIFSSPSGQFWLYEDYKQVYERLLKKHGLSVSVYNPYRFRHNCCTRLFRLNVNIKTIQMIMGDNTPDMVMRVYANLEKDDVLKGSAHYADSLDTALGVVSKHK